LQCGEEPQHCPFSLSLLFATFSLSVDVFPAYFSLHSAIPRLLPYTSVMTRSRSILALNVDSHHSHSSLTLCSPHFRQAAEGFDPRRSKVSDSTMSAFMSAPISGSLVDVPGIGEKTAEKLAGENITNLYQLIGMYLSFKGPDTLDEEGNIVTVDVRTHNDRFWYWLQSVGISAHRSAIVAAIAKKCAMFMPDLYDPQVYEEDDDDDDDE
jgi:hypothetical protein